MSHSILPAVSQSQAFINNTDQWPGVIRYSPLSQEAGRAEIRLLELSYDAKFNRIDCALTHYDLNSQKAEPFHALSYYWGAPGINRIIFVDGHAVPIRKSLHDFLKALGRQFKGIKIWLDVMCIDQNNSSERNKQVSMMVDIFSKAENVFAWLGKGDADTNLLFDTLAALSLQNRMPLDKKIMLSATKLFAYAEHLLQHPYFRRLWIIQECVVARNLFFICGSKLMEWQLLYHSVLKLHEYMNKEFSNGHYVQLQSGFGHSLELFQVLESEKRNAMTLRELVEKFPRSQCEEPRDKVYGFRGLAQECQMIKVDYSKSMVDTFLEAVWTSISKYAPGPTISDWRNEVVKWFKVLPLNEDEIASGLQDAIFDRNIAIAPICKASDWTQVVTFRWDLEKSEWGHIVAINPSEKESLIGRADEAFLIPPFEEGRIVTHFTNDLGLPHAPSNHYYDLNSHVPIWVGDIIGPVLWKSNLKSIGFDPGLAILWRQSSVEANLLEIIDIVEVGKTGMFSNTETFEVLKLFREVLFPGGLQVCRFSTRLNSRLHFSRATLFLLATLRMSYESSQASRKGESDSMDVNAARKIQQILLAWLRQNKAWYDTQQLCHCKDGKLR